MPSPSVSPIIATMSAGEARRASILVVDDEPTIAEVVARYLDRAGYETRTAADGPGAVARRRTRAPRPRCARHHAPRLRWARGDAPTARGPRGARRRDPAHGEGRGVRSRPRAAPRRRRLRRQAVLAGGAASPGSRPSCAAATTAGPNAEPLRRRTSWRSTPSVGRFRSATARSSSPSASSTSCTSSLAIPARCSAAISSWIGSGASRSIPTRPRSRSTSDGCGRRSSRTRRIRAGSRRCGGSATASGRGRDELSLAIALAAGVVTGAVIAPVYGAEPGLVTGVLVTAIAAVGLAARAPDCPRALAATASPALRGGGRRLRSA